MNPVYLQCYFREFSFRFIKRKITQKTLIEISPTNQPKWIYQYYTLRIHLMQN